MSTLLEAPARQVVSFRPTQSGWFLNDDGTGEIPRCFGKVICPGCGHWMEAATTPGEVEANHCPNYDSRRLGWCGSTIWVRVDLSHECGDPLCAVCLMRKAV